jgi:hypothetical protein
MQYQVPQFIDSEDKVVGPFSLRQFLYVGVAAVISGVCYFLVQSWLFFIIALILIGGSLALSFVKINGRPLMKVGLSAFNFYWRPQTYVWKSDHPVQQYSKPTAEKAVELPPMAAAITPAEPKPKPIYTPAAPKSTQSISLPHPPMAPAPKTIAAIAEGSSLHKTWERLQSGTPIKAKKSDKQFLEKKMNERYQIFQRRSGEREAARRIDYR